MRLSQPRVQPLVKSDWDEDQAALLAPYENENGLLNIYATVGRKPKAAKAFLTWGRYVLRESSLDDRQRELLILRIGWLCKSGYEFAQHSRLALRAGMTMDDIVRIKTAPLAPEWTENERTLLKAADELHGAYFISNQTWSNLGQFLTDEQRNDVVYVVGHYTQVCMILNSFGIQLEPGQTVDPALVE